jgi:hypothetical protein
MLEPNNEKNNHGWLDVVAIGIIILCVGVILRGIFSLAISGFCQ